MSNYKYDLIICNNISNQDIDKLSDVISKYISKLKPGGHIAITTHYTNYDYVGMALRLLGIEIRDMLVWISSVGNIPTILGRKQFKGTVANNMIKYGVGGINIDECRVPLENDETIATNVGFLDNLQSDGWGTKKCITEKKAQGRFPANVIISYDENEYVLDDKISKENKKKVMEWLSENI